MDKKPQLFISYSHQDEEWKDQILRHLRATQRRGEIDVFDTSDIEAGAEWAPRILQALNESDLAVILISPDALASEFIVQRELPALLQRQRAGRLAVLPVHVRRSLWTDVPGLAELQSANPPTEPLADLPPERSAAAVASIAERVSSVLRAFGERSASADPSNELPTLAGAAESKRAADPPFFISHAHENGDFAELLALRMQRQGHEAWIDLDRLLPGVDWQENIDVAIKGARAVIAVMSPEARSSEYVTYEWAFAWGCGVKIIPIMLRETSLHPRLARLQYLDFTRRESRPWQKLFEALKTTSSADGGPSAGSSQRFKDLR